MNIPKPYRTMRRVIRANHKPYIVTRPNSSVDSLGDLSETEATHNASLWVQRQFEFNEQTDFGEVLRGDLYGVALPNTDIQEGDRISHGGKRFEAETVLGHPSDEQKEYLIVSFTYMRNG